MYMLYNHWVQVCASVDLMAVDVDLMAVDYCMSVGLRARSGRVGFQGWVWLCTSLAALFMY
jgi:hypothetical protein